MFIYSIFDKKAMYHRSQFFMRSDAEAVRQLHLAANDSRSDIAMFPDDFALYCLGEFNINDGVITPFAPIKFVCEAASLVKIDETSES